MLESGPFGAAGGGGGGAREEEERGGDGLGALRHGGVGGGEGGVSCDVSSVASDMSHGSSFTSHGSSFTAPRAASPGGAGSTSPEELLVCELVAHTRAVLSAARKKSWREKKKLRLACIIMTHLKH